jgi:hypothetical protein
MQRKVVLYPVELIQGMELLADERHIHVSVLYREAVTEYLRTQTMKGNKSGTPGNR